MLFAHCKSVKHMLSIVQEVCIMSLNVDISASNFRSRGQSGIRVMLSNTKHRNLGPSYTIPDYYRNDIKFCLFKVDSTLKIMTT